MGYSCTAAASFTLDAIQLLLNQPSSNGMPNGGFWERGREQPDGAITGTVFKRAGTYSPSQRAAKAREMSAGGVDVKPEWIGDPVVRAGSFRIEPDGKVTRFPQVRAALLRKAEKMGEMKFRETFGPPGFYDWKFHRDRVVELLVSDVEPRHLWDDFQEVVRHYQVDRKVAFMSLPGLHKQDMIEWLAGLE